MIRLLVYTGLFLLLIGIETGFLASLPFTQSFVPLVLSFSLAFFHVFSSRIGLWYILAWGVWYDLFGLSLWSSTTLVAVLLIVSLAYAGERLFSRQSLYGLLGITILAWILWIFVEALFRLGSQEPLSIAFDHFFIHRFRLLFEFLVLTTIWFSGFLHLRKTTRAL